MTSVHHVFLLYGPLGFGEVSRSVLWLSISLAIYYQLLQNWCHIERFVKCEIFTGISFILFNVQNLWCATFQILTRPMKKMGHLTTETHLILVKGYCHDTLRQILLPTFSTDWLHKGKTTQVNRERIDGPEIACVPGGIPGRQLSRYDERRLLLLSLNVRHLLLPLVGFLWRGHWQIQSH